MIRVVPCGFAGIGQLRSPRTPCRMADGSTRVSSGCGSTDRLCRSPACAVGPLALEGRTLGSVIKKRRKRMAKKKHRKLLKKTRVQRRKLGK